MRGALLFPIVAFALLWVPVSAASTSSPGSSSLTIVTVPAQAGIRFELGDTTVATGADGTAEIAAATGTYPLRVLDTTVRRPGIRSTFSRWGDNSFQPSRTIRIRGSRRLEVGFEQSVRVGFRFVDRSDRPVDTQRVSKLTLASTTGTRESFRPDRERWLLAGRVTRRFNGLEQTRIQYAVERAVVDGSNVVNRSQQRFFPLQRREVALRLLLYSARVGAHDLVFGFPLGKTLDLVYPDGHRATHELHGRQLVLQGLPRGTYRIKVHTWGYSPVVSLALSKDQNLELRIGSYLDLFVIALLVVGVTGVLVLLPRPALRKSLRGPADRAVRVAALRVGELASWARSVCGRDGPVRRALAGFLVAPRAGEPEEQAGEPEPEPVADDPGAPTPPEEAQEKLAPRLPRWIPLPLDAPEPPSPEGPASPGGLRLFPSTAARYVRTVFAGDRGLSTAAAAHSAKAARAPSRPRWVPLPLEAPLQEAISSPAVAPGPAVGTISRELAAADNAPVSGSLAEPVGPAIRYQLASGERRW